MSHTVRHQVRRVYRNRLLVSLAYLLFFSNLILVNRGAFRDLLFGASDLSATLLSNIRNPDRFEGRWVRASGKGLSLPESLAPDLRRRYFVLNIDESYVIVRGDRPENTQLIRGRLKSAVFGEAADIISKLGREYPEIQGRFATVQLDARASRVVGYLNLVCVVLGLASALFAIYLWATGFERPFSTTELQRLFTYGFFENLVDEVETHFQARAEKNEGVGYSQFGNGCFLGATHLNLFLVPLSEIVWVYEQPVVGKFFPVIHVCDRKGNRYRLLLSERRRLRLLEIFRCKVPWAIHGYKKNYEVLYEADRQAFIQLIEDRSREVTAGAYQKAKAVQR